MSEGGENSRKEPGRLLAESGVPHWPAAIALLVVGGIYLQVSERLTLGPPWLPLAVALALLVLRRVARLRGLKDLTHWLGLVTIAIVTVLVAASAVFLVTQLPGGTIGPTTLLLDAALIWVANVLTFAVWYWEIDGGGPSGRHPARHLSEEFLFPQMTAPGEITEGWSPGFVDYVFLAFNTSTAFSPTDTLVLSRRAKVLMMAQSLISLLAVAVLAARAINAL